MIKLSKANFLQIFTNLLLLLALSKAISLVALWYFPSEGVDVNIKENYQPMYQRVDFANMFDKTQNKKNTTVSDSNNPNNINITSMILKGLYGTNARGYAIVAMKSSPANTSIVGVSQEYQGYVLKSILNSSVIFSKENKEYVLLMEDMKTLPTFESDNNKNINDIQHTISREDIKNYSNDPQNIWKDISIEEVKNNNKIFGFQVMDINSQSRFASLGLQKGDIIIKVNNVPLTSYKEAIDVYNNLDILHTVQIVLIRKDQEKELVYEIH